MKMNVVILSIYFLLYNIVPFAESDLVATIVLFRHGDSNRGSQTFQTDAYQDESHWPEGYGELVKPGKVRSYHLGKLLRQRYGKILSANYKAKELEVLSSDANRCLMSAATVLAGLYEPAGDDQWLTEFKWEPVPIHTRPEEDDLYISQKASCKEYDKLFKKAKELKDFKELAEEHSEVFKFLADNTGDDVTHLEYFRWFYKTIYIYRENKKTFLPAWLESASNETKEKIDHLGGMAFALKTYTPELKRLSAGPLLHKITEYFENIISGNSTLKLVLLSGHETTVVGILNTLGLYKNIPPEFCTSIIWELQKVTEEDFYIRMYYVKGRREYDLELMQLDKCEIDCHLNTYKEIVEPYALDMDTWKKECNSAENFSPPSHLTYFFIMKLYILFQ